LGLKLNKALEATARDPPIGCSRQVRGRSSIKLHLLSLCSPANAQLLVSTSSLARIRRPKLRELPKLACNCAAQAVESYKYITPPQPLSRAASLAFFLLVCVRRQRNMISSILLCAMPLALQANAASIPASAQAVGLDISATLQNILANTQNSDGYTYPTDLTRGIVPVG
jgi:hypothetical protein